MNDKMYEMLINLENKNNLVAIYTDEENPENFNVGFVAAINENDIIIKHVAPSGSYDGFILKKTAEIFQIEYEGGYINKIEKLYRLQTKRHSRFPISNTNLTTELLKFAIENKFVVSVELNNDGIMNAQGVVLDVNEDDLQIAQLDEYGNKDGYANLDVRSITRIDCDTDQEQILRMLINN